MNEIDLLPVKFSYRYAIASYAASQLGIILIYNVHMRHSIPAHAVTGGLMNHVDLCTHAADLCENFLLLGGCSADLMHNLACVDMADVSTHRGTCSCRNFDSTRFSSLIIDSQVRGNISASVVNIWPASAREVDAPTEVFDVCLTYERVCEHMLDRIGCPAQDRSVDACDRRGIFHGKSPTSHCQLVSQLVSQSVVLLLLC